MNLQETQQKAAQLTDAFHLFNQLSQNLTQSYQDLEQQVAKLTRELNASRSERLKTLLEKERLANRMQTILAALPAAVIILDGQQTVIDCNALAVTYLQEPLLGLSWSDILGERIQNRSDNPFESSLKNGMHIKLTYNRLDENGSQLILITDVSEMQHLQESLAQQQQLSAMGEMVASLAHQVRTPLATALLYASQLNKAELLPEKRLLFTSKVMERLHHLDRQVNDMLLFAKGGKFVMSNVSVTELLSKIQDSLTDCIGSREIEFNCDRQTTVELFPGNSAAILGAIMNILNNSLDAIQETGRISLQVSTNQDKIEFSISDNGSGMTPEMLEKIHEPFFTTKINGCGLGLAVVKSVLAAHHGTLACQSELGRGSSFTLRFALSGMQAQPLLSDKNHTLEQDLPEQDYA